MQHCKRHSRDRLVPSHGVLASARLAPLVVLLLACVSGCGAADEPADLDTPHTQVEALQRDREGLSPTGDAITDTGALVSRLRQHDLSEREFVVAMLRNGPDVVSELVPLLQDKEYRVRHAAIEALVLLRDPRSFDALVPVLVADGAGESSRALVRLGSPIVPRLVARLDDPNPTTRAEVASVLGRIGDPSAVEPLIQAMKDCIAPIQRALAGMRPLPTQAVLGALRSPRREVRLWAVAELARMDDEAAIAPLVEALADEDFEVRPQVKAAIARSGPRAVTPLIAALRHADAAVREHAADLLQQIEWTPRNAAEVAHKLALARDWDELIACGPDAVDPLVAALLDADAAVRARAATGLGAVGDPRGVPPLLGALQDGAANVRRDAVCALARLGDPRAVAPLTACLLNDQDDDVRAEAALALGASRTAQAVEPLLAVLAAIPPVAMQPRRTPMGPLVLEIEARPTPDRDQPRPPPLKPASAFPPPTGQRRLVANAILALGVLRDVRAVGPLLERLRDGNSWAIRAAAAQTLAQLGAAPAIGPLTEALYDVCPQVRAQAASSLAALRAESATARLVDMLFDWDAAPAAASALIALGWVPATTAERVHLMVAMRQRAPLLADWQTTRAVLETDLHYGTERARDSALLAFVGLGRDDVVETLARQFDVQATPATAEAFLNSGCEPLAQAARKWAKRQGLTIGGGGGYAPVRWGGM